MVVPDFFYGDPVIDYNDPNFDVKSWGKVHNPVSFLRFNSNLGWAYEKFCKNQQNKQGPFWFAFDDYHMFMHVLFGT